jgi:hypothetical protein
VLGPLAANWNAMKQDIWTTLTWMNKAILNASAAWHELQYLRLDYDSWNSAANTMHWVSTLAPYTPEVVTRPFASSSSVCFGYPACSVAGAFGGMLDCCKTLPGCCPGDFACCSIKDFKMPLNDTDSSSMCHGEPSCAALRLDCCESPDGCCKTTNASLLLGCCKPQHPQQQAMKPITTKQVTSSNDTGVAACHNQPTCAALDLDCCHDLDGCCTVSVDRVPLECCQSTPTSPTLMPLLLPSSSSSSSSSCHDEPVCAALGLACCASPEGCCERSSTSGKVPLLCCRSSGSSASASSSSSSRTAANVKGTSNDQDMLTCFDNPRCLTAGVNGSALWCCASEYGCCPGMECCDNMSLVQVEKILAIVLCVTIGLCGILYAIRSHARRRPYQTIDAERDGRSWFCAGFMVITLVVFFYLIMMDMHWTSDASPI